MALTFKISPLQMKEYGVVAEIKQDIAHITGLTNCMNGQMVHFDGGSLGTIVGFDNGYELVMIVKEASKIKPGDKLYSTIESCSVPVGEQFLGRVVNGLAEPTDGMGPVKADKRYPIFNESPSVLERTPLVECLETGVKILDMMNPVGKGQRQLILGDRVTGKTTIATDAILNQKGKGVICIYCCIGKAEASLNKVLDLFRDRDELWDRGGGHGFGHCRPAISGALCRRQPRRIFHERKGAGCLCGLRRPHQACLGVPADVPPA